MAHERIKPEFLFDDEKIKQLKQIAPECFEDGKLNFETLRQNLGNWAQDEEDGDLEHFGLFWPGKKDARRLASIPPEGTLEPVYGQGLKSDGTPDDDSVNDSKNIFIEGENLEVLKILQKSYANKIKMIYIDPPYNTGNDFVYDDDFTEPLQEYLRRTGQIDEEGKPLTTNKKSDGRFHSKWLTMIYPRLRLARNLLKEDGVIFVSIDNNEVHNLRAVMNEVFGEENFISCVANINNPKGRSDDKYIATSHEYVLIFKKSDLSFYGWEPEEKVIKRYNKTDEDGAVYREIDLRKTGDADRKEDRESMFYYFYYNEETGDFFPSKDKMDLTGYIEIIPLRADNSLGRWRWELNTAKNNITQIFPKLMPTRKIWGVMEKDYLTDEKRVKPTSSWTQKWANSERGTEQFVELGFDKRVFKNPKPIGFIQAILQMATSDNDIILDFFAGSGSSAHALYDLEINEKKNRKIIQVQYPEPLNKDDETQKYAYEFCKDHSLAFNISEITKERIRRVISKVESNEGFKCFKLSSSNYRKWKDIQSEDVLRLESSLDLFNSSPLREDWNNNKLLTELILLEGFPLDASQAKSQIGTNEIVKVESEMVPNTLLICLDDEIEESLIDQLELDNSSTFICLDSAISNQNKLRLSDKGLIKTI
ncbi:site-specific DNA-methyltransferase [Eudoraea chungangensis]|uniref:site-specific DNA-methyltransferase n=1 Tax=Eudoraea chungangensis TaxID=1481905 RepID=UPI0023ECDCA1|nr:site-specific DNA-methyltransferase [Eudoraea chungangensis]